MPQRRAVRCCSRLSKPVSSNLVSRCALPIDRNVCVSSRRETWTSAAESLLSLVVVAAVVVVVASTLEKASGAGMDMKTVLTATFWFEGFELGLSTTWNRSVDARAVFSVNAVIFLSAILFPLGYVMGLITVKVKIR